MKVYLKPVSRIDGLDPNKFYERKSIKSGIVEIVVPDSDTTVKKSNSYFGSIRVDLSFGLSLSKEYGSSSISFIKDGIYNRAGVSVYKSHVSCGIAEVEGLMNIESALIAMSLYKKNRKSKEGLLLFKEVVEAINLILKSTYAFSLFSCPIDQYYSEAMDEIADQTSETILNPNSGNKIKIWTFILN